jgi:hypothetical protein
LGGTFDIRSVGTGGTVATVRLPAKDEQWKRF